MKKLTTSILFLLLCVIATGVASAGIKVTISDGTTTRTGTSGTPTFGQFNLWMASAAGSTNTLNILSCTPRPCTVFFPSGSNTLQAGDTFKFQDINATTSFARIIKTDSSTDRIELKGFKGTSLVAAKTLTLTFETESGNFTTINSASGSYPFSLALVGSFKNSAGTGLATACPNPTTLTATQLQTPCATLLLQVNGITANGTGPAGIATASIPCKNGTVTPCATAGGSYAATGSFSATDSSSISCGTTCNPIQRAILTARFNGANETLTSANSGIGAFSNDDEANFGYELLAVDLANELGTQWVPPYSAGNELYQAVPRPPMGKITRVNNNFSFPIKFGLKRGELVAASQASGLNLLSIVDDPELDTLSENEQARYLRSYASFVPTQPQLVPCEDCEDLFEVTGGLEFGDLTTLQFNFDVFTGLVGSGDRRLGDVNFSDCTNGSIRVKIDLLDPDSLEPVGPVYVYLGRDSDDGFRSDCDPTEVTEDLVGNLDERVDTSFVGGFCCRSFADAQFGEGGFSNFFVRSISFVVDQGFCGDCTLPEANYGVAFLRGQVSYQPCGECDPIDFIIEPNQPDFPLFVTGNFISLTGPDFPQDGVSVKVYKLTPAPVLVLETTNVTIVENQYKAVVNASNLQLDPGTTNYRADLCLFGGRCIADSGFFGLKN